MTRLTTNLGILWLFLFVIFGCSTSREVAVVGHGEAVAPAPAAVLENRQTPSTVKAVISPQKLEEDIPSSPAQPNRAISDSPMISLQPEENIVRQEIFAQSAEDTTVPWTLQDVFFDYDQMAIRPDAILLLEQNAKVLLKRYPNREVLIEGHCDERGTQAYNLILGERRADAVKNYLVNLGVEPSRLRVLSLGKSQPFCLQRTLACFRQNRRAHFVLK